MTTRQMTAPPCALDVPDDYCQLAADDLLLHPIAYADPWNGFAVPIVRAKTYADYIARWRANDPNGTWGEVVEALDETGARVLLDISIDADIEHVGLTLRGQPVTDRYSLDLESLFDVVIADLPYEVNYWHAGEAGVYALDGLVWTQMPDPSQ